jgi:nucleotide-binding universal stress UspA family protein
MAGRVVARDASVAMSNQQIDISRPILCGVDNSPGARNAGAVAVALSARTGLPLIFVHAASDVLHLSLLARDRNALGRAVSGAELVERTIGRVTRGHDSMMGVAVGQPAERLSKFAAALGAEMVVVASRRPRLLKRRRLGSVARYLIAVSEVPVLLVAPDARIPAMDQQAEQSQGASVLCGIDTSFAAHSAAEVASLLAARLDDRLVFVRAYEPLSAGRGRSDEIQALSPRRAVSAPLDAARHSLQHVLDPNAELGVGPRPLREMSEAMRREAAELLVVGTDRPSRPDRWSMPDGLIASCPIPLLVVPSCAAGPPQSGDSSRCSRPRSGARGQLGAAPDV